MLELVLADEEAAPPDAAEGEVEVWREHEQICAYGYHARGHDWLHVPQVATFRFPRATEPVVAHPVGGATEREIRDAFERSALPLALQSFGRQALHASAVRTGAGVVAFCGDSGTGKSTLAYAGSRRGHELWADDAVAFEVRSDGVFALPLPFRILLRPESLAHFGVAVEHETPSRLAAREAPVAAVVILEREREGLGISLDRLAPAEAFTAVLAQGYCYRPSDTIQNERMVREYLELAARVAILRARFEPRFDSTETLLDALEDELRNA